MFNRMQSMQMQAVHCFQKGDYRAIIAIHNTFLGPALGGCRCLPYATENQAFDDAMRLARGMSYKAALANVAHGGGKSVLLMPKQDFDREDMFRWFGECVEELKGQYITAMDAGTQVSDMNQIATVTDYVASAGSIGDPAPYTAQGVMCGIRAAVEFRLGREPGECRYAVQGLGHVGMHLCRMLLETGADVIASDPDQEKCNEAEAMGVLIVSPDALLKTDADVFVPCALGGVINEQSIKQMNFSGFSVVAGSANNQLTDEHLGVVLKERGILYAPDYVINSGGLIYAAERFGCNSDEIISKKINAVYQTLMSLFEHSERSGQAVSKTANDIAETILRGEPVLARTPAGSQGGFGHAA